MVLLPCQETGCCMSSITSGYLDLAYIFSCFSSYYLLMFALLALGSWSPDHPESL